MEPSSRIRKQTDMRLRLALILLLFAGLVQAQTPTLIDVAASPNSSANSPANAFSFTPDYRAPLAEPTFGGETLIFPFCYDNTGNNQSFTITDTQSDPWTLEITSATSGGKQCRVYVASNVAAGVTWVNAHMDSGSSAGYRQGTVSKFYNVTASSPMDGTGSCNTATSTSVSAGAWMLAASGDLIFQFAYASNYVYSTPQETAAFTPGSGFTALYDLAGDGAAAQYEVYSSAGSITPILTQPASYAYISCAIALKAGASGSASTLYPRVVHEEIDAKPKNAGAAWASVMVSTTGNVYISSLTNDAPATGSPVNSSPSPAVAWAASGADFVGLNGHNHTNIFSAQFSSAPGMFNLTETVQGGGNDAIYDIYDVVGGSPALDVDSGGQAGYQSTFVSSLPVCSSCLTPTHQNDFIISNFGQLLCTATSLTLPSSGWIDDAGYDFGQSINGPSQVSQNNGFAHGRNGSSLSAITVSYGETCSSGEQPQNWAGRVAAYQSISQGTPPAPPTGLVATVN
jgi:hypothetical protein